MRGTGRPWIALAAASAFLAVAFGAFAAHGLTDPKAQEVMRTGSTYEMFHALAILACVALTPVAPRARFAPPLFLAGAVLFSGSLYALALGAPRLVGIATPFGGLCFLAGWAVLVWAALTARATDA
ncbi:MAG TPA: DUF423 domain-containing protein [Caulobacteraceae bacterium]|nr:DUF423 domain-containing protein [Caulobacteraceae bacterium]